MNGFQRGHNQRRTCTAQSRSLLPETILDVARAGGVQVPTPRGTKVTIACPFHEDSHPSAFLDHARGVFYCSVCSAPDGWSTRRFARELRLPSRVVRLDSTPPDFPAPARKIPPFTATEAQAIWVRARSLAREHCLDRPDDAVRSFLQSRGILAAATVVTCGVLAPGMPLPRAIASWPARGYRLVLPLFDARGTLANIQVRAVTAARPKTLFPKGSRATGTLFASTAGHELLTGRRTGGRVVLGEGLTDFLALSLATSTPVLSIPGTSHVDAAIGPWIRDCDVLIAFDADRTGQEAVLRAAGTARAAGARRVRSIRWPEGCKDACDVLQSCGLDALARSLGGFSHD